MRKSAIVDAGGVRSRGQEVGHGEHRRARVEPEAVALEQAGPAAGHRAALDHGDVVAPARQVAGGRQAAEAGADHDDATRVVTTAPS